ncbi:MAG: hypothetical protein JRN20_17045 [Nitrososphaerota archaeon]|nr:hypothetical protein [Nitrososphaerota archaeon]
MPSKDNPKSKLEPYLTRKLLGSSVEVASVSGNEISIKAGDSIVLKISIDEAKKKIDFNLFSPSLNRIIPFEEVMGTGLLDVRLDEQLKSKNHEAEVQDTMLAIDLLQQWAKENEYSLSHIASK